MAKVTGSGRNRPFWSYPDRPSLPGHRNIGVRRGCSSYLCHPSFFLRYYRNPSMGDALSSKGVRLFVHSLADIWMTESGSWFMWKVVYPATSPLRLPEGMRAESWWLVLSLFVEVVPSLEQPLRPFLVVL